MAKTVLETLEAARKLIEAPEQWCQNRFKDDRGARCMAKALLDVPCGEDSYTSAYTSIWHVVGGSIPQFNDAPGRTHAEVLAAFDEAIAAEKAKVANV